VALGEALGGAVRVDGCAPVGVTSLEGRLHPNRARNSAPSDSANPCARRAFRIEGPFKPGTSTLTASFQPHRSPLRTQASRSIPIGRSWLPVDQPALAPWPGCDGCPLLLDDLKLLRSSPRRPLWRTALGDGGNQRGLREKSTTEDPRDQPDHFEWEPKGDDLSLRLTGSSSRRGDAPSRRRGRAEVSEGAPTLTAPPAATWSRTRPPNHRGSSSMCR
jgi:hypothetical protein